MTFRLSHVTGQRWTAISRSAFFPFFFFNNEGGEEGGGAAGGAAAAAAAAAFRNIPFLLKRAAIV